MKDIFVVNGFPRSGKTAFGEMVGHHLDAVNIPFIHASSITLPKALIRPEPTWPEPVKNIVSQFPKIREIRDRLGMIDWDGVKTRPARDSLAFLKEEITKLDSNIIPLMIAEEIEMLPKGGVAFVDIREPNSIRQFQNFMQHRSQDGVSTVFIESPQYEAPTNPADLHVKKLEYDFFIENRPDLPPDRSWPHLENEAASFLHDTHIKPL